VEDRTAVVTRFEQIQRALEDENPEALLADGFEDALVGVVRRCGQPTLAAYSYARALEVLMMRDGMEYDDAVEWMEFNVVGAWFGPHTPAWLVEDV
jgi:hypothetical protein